MVIDDKSWELWYKCYISYLIGPTSSDTQEWIIFFIKLVWPFAVSPSCLLCYGLNLKSLMALHYTKLSEMFYFTSTLNLAKSIYVLTVHYMSELSDSKQCSSNLLTLALMSAVVFWKSSAYMK